MSRKSFSRRRLATQLASVFVISLVSFPARAQAILELSAHDRKGNVVLDLTPSDVQITDDGKPVPLNNLRLVKEPQVPPAVTLLFDEVNPGVAKQAYDQAEEILNEASGHGVVFTVLRVEGRLHLMQAPTTDLNAVRKAVAATTMANRPELLRATDAAEQQMEEDAKSGTGSRQIMAKVLRAMLLDSQRIVKTEGRTTPSVAALLAASRGQEILRGRKFLIYFTYGIAYPKNTPELLRDIAQAANRAQVSIYAIDAEAGDSDAAASMITGSTMGMESALGNVTSSTTDAAGAATVGGEFSGRMIAGEGGAIPHSLMELCFQTGGVDAFSGGGDSRSWSRGIGADLTSYYLASWTPPSAGDAGRRSQIRVKSLRKGVTIESRFAARIGDQETHSAAEGRLLEALAATKLPAGLPLRAAVLRFGTPGNETNSIVVQVPLDHPAAQPGASGLSAGKISVLVQLKDASGAVVRRFSGDIPGRSGFVSFRRQFSVPPGDYVLESVAMDGGRIGAERDNVTIPDVANRGPALGDLVLVGSVDPPGVGEGADPLRCAEGIVVPNLSGRVGKAESPKISLFFDLHVDSGSAAPALSAEIRRDDTVLGSVPLKLAVDANRPSIPYMFALATSNLSPGRYRVTVTLGQGVETVSRSTSFTLE